MNGGHRRDLPRSMREREYYLVTEDRDGPVMPPELYTGPHEGGSPVLITTAEGHMYRGRTVGSKSTYLTALKDIGKMPENGIWSIDGQVITRSETGKVGAWTLDIVLAKDASSARIVGTTVTSVASDPSLSGAFVEIKTDMERYFVEVNGVKGLTLHWKGRLSLHSLP